MRARVALRTRLVAIYAAVFVASMSLVLVVSYLLLAQHLRATLIPGAAEPILDRLASQYLLALVGTTLLAISVGWLAARRLLMPLHRITEAARQASDDRLDARLSLGGPHDELRELGDTFDAMLDRFQGSIEAQRRFIANASHELRSPLTAIRTEAEVTLADPDATTADLRRMGERVIEDADHLDELLAGLMILARSQRGLLRTEQLDLATVAERAATDGGPATRSEGLTLRTSLQSAPVLGDEALLRRLVANLVDNATRYNAPGGHVEVTTAVDGDRAVLRVSNSGRRIPPGDVERLRQPFERLGRHGDGNGLGLSIVQAVAEAHQGTVRLLAPENGGLEVIVLLPLGAAVAASVASAAGAGSVGAARRR